MFQNNMVQVLETALIDGTNKVPEAVQPSLVNSLLDMSPLVVGSSGGIEFDNSIKCSVQGIFFLPVFFVDGIV